MRLLYGQTRRCLEYMPDWPRAYMLVTAAMNTSSTPNWDYSDAVTVQDTVHLVVARPDSGSIVHEALHSLFAPALERTMPAIDASSSLYAPVRDSMVGMGYAWDDSPASRRRTIRWHRL